MAMKKAVMQDEILQFMYDNKITFQTFSRRKFKRMFFDDIEEIYIRVQQNRLDFFKKTCEVYGLVIRDVFSMVDYGKK